MIKERNTKQKQIIYSALCTLGHPTATEVYEYVHEESPTIGRGTVFRVLGAFAESGRARRVHLRDSDERFDATTSPHYHARCRVCGRVSDVFSTELAHFLAATNTGDFCAEEAEVEFRGICRACSAEKK